MTVGQDLLKMELGGAPGVSEKQEGGQEPKAPAPDDQPTSSDPKPSQDEAKSKQESSPPPSHPPPPDAQPPKDQSKSSPPKKEPPRPESSPKLAESKKPEPKSTGGGAIYGSREERRVRALNQLTLSCGLTAI